LLLVIIGVALAGAGAAVMLIGPGGEKVQYDLSDKKVLIVIFENYQPMELGPVRNMLTKCKAKVSILAVNKTVGIGYDYYILDVKGKLRELTESYDGIVIIGGPGVYVRVIGEVRDPGLDVLEQLCREFDKRGKLIAAICAAPGVLARAGVLEGRKATCYPDSRLISLLKESGAKYVSERVVRDGNVITSVGPETADDFAKAICEYLSKH